MKSLASSRLSQLKVLGGYRDAVLVLATLVYFFGYLSWAFYAGANDLGLIPALRAQYLVAGMIPIVIFAAGVALGVLQWRLSRWAFENPSPKRFRWGSYLTVTATVLMVGGGLTAWVFGKVHQARAENIATFIGVIGGTYIMMAGSLLQGSRSAKWLRVYGLAVLWLVVAFVPIALLLGYFERVFPNLPTALGGPRPRCVVIDVPPTTLSAETRAALFTKPDTVVARTRPLELLFSGAEFTMVRVKAAKPVARVVNGKLVRVPVYSVATRNIVALATCPGETS